MTRYYKAVRPDGTDFHTGTVRWLPEDLAVPDGGWLVKHPTATVVGPRADAYLSVSTTATDCTGMWWPCLLLAVEPAGEVVAPDADSLPHKRAAVAWRVVEVLPATDALGPQGVEVAAIIERAGRITVQELSALAAAGYAAWDAARDAAWVAARVAAWDAARDAAWVAARVAAWSAAWDAARDAARVAAWSAAWGAARDAALATLARDLITTEQHDLLIGPWRSVIEEPAA